jgi:hypothetical protein
LLAVEWYINSLYQVFSPFGEHKPELPENELRMK